MSLSLKTLWIQLIEVKDLHKHFDIFVRLFFLTKLKKKG